MGTVALSRPEEEGYCFVKVKHLLRPTKRFAPCNKWLEPRAHPRKGRSYFIKSSTATTKNNPLNIDVVGPNQFP